MVREYLPPRVFNEVHIAGLPPYCESFLFHVVGLGGAYIMAEHRTAFPITQSSRNKICDNKTIWRQRSGMGELRNLYRITVSSIPLSSVLYRKGDWRLATGGWGSCQAALSIFLWDGYKTR